MLFVIYKRYIVVKIFIIEVKLVQITNENFKQLIIIYVGFFNQPHLAKIKQNKVLIAMK